jgi:hypothetical protein
MVHLSSVLRLTQASKEVKKIAVAIEAGAAKRAGVTP